MRRWLVCTALLALALSACEMSAEINVKPDGSGTMAVQFGIEKSLMGLLASQGDSADPFADFRKDLADDPVSWTVESYERDGLKGVRASFPFSSISDLMQKAAAMEQADGSTRGAPFDALALRKTATGWEFHAKGETPDVGSFGGGDLTPPAPSGFPTDFPTNFPTDFPGGVPPVPSSIPSSGFEGLEELAGSIDFQLRVTLPGKAASTNATKTESHGGSTTFVWKIDVSGQAPTEMSATTIGFGSSSFPMVPVAAGGGAVAAAAIALYAFRRRRTPTLPPPVLEGDWPPAGPPRDATDELPPAVSGRDGPSGP